MISKLSASYLATLCKNGWWPYVAGQGESLEASVWCSIACRKNVQLAHSALTRFVATQNSDGGWATAPGDGQSDWSTAAALAAINVLSKEPDAVDAKLTAALDAAMARGYKRLIGLRADLVTDMTRLALMLTQGPEADYPHGWPWEPDTYHWVEPTSYAIFAIKTSPFANEKRYKRLVSEAEQYLLEKTCADGGWNFGSPRTLGTDWISLAPPTSLAPLAMQGFPNAKVERALDYLRNLKGPIIDSTLSDSLAFIARHAHGDNLDEEHSAFIERFNKRQHAGENLLSLAAGIIASNLVSEGNPFKIAVS